MTKFYTGKHDAVYAKFNLDLEECDGVHLIGYQDANSEEIINRISILEIDDVNIKDRYYSPPIFLGLKDSINIIIPFNIFEDDLPSADIRMTNFEIFETQILSVFEKAIFYFNSDRNNSLAFGMDFFTKKLYKKLGLFV